MTKIQMLLSAMLFAGAGFAMPHHFGGSHAGGHALPLPQPSPSGLNCFQLCCGIPHGPYAPCCSACNITGICGCA